MWKPHFGQYFLAFGIVGPQLKSAIGPQTVAEDIFITAMGPKCIVIPPLEMLLLAYSLTSLLA